MSPMSRVHAATRVHAPRLASRLALALALAVGLTACDRAAAPGAGGAAPAAFHSVDITGAEYANVLQLPDADGQMRDLGQWKGKVVVVFFGYAQCPDVCPTTLTELSAIKRQLGADGERIQGVFVTVDPERDTAEVLRAYVAAFGPGFTALRGTPEQIQAAARSFKVYYAKVPGKTETTYTVDHSAGSYVFDPQGRVRLYARYGQPADKLAADLKRLLDESPKESP
jgi:protein SCO1